MGYMRKFLYTICLKKFVKSFSLYIPFSLDSGVICDSGSLVLLQNVLMNQRIAKRISVLAYQCNGMTSKYSLHCLLVSQIFNIKKFSQERDDSPGGLLVFQPSQSQIFISQFHIKKKIVYYAICIKETDLNIDSHNK